MVSATAGAGDTGGADATSISAFAEEIKRSVETLFGIALEQEPVEPETV